MSIFASYLLHGMIRFLGGNREKTAGCFCDLFVDDALEATRRALRGRSPRGVIAAVHAGMVYIADRALAKKPRNLKQGCGAVLVAKVAP